MNRLRVMIITFLLISLPGVFLFGWGAANHFRGDDASPTAVCIVLRRQLDDLHVVQPGTGHGDSYSNYIVETLQRGVPVSGLTPPFPKP